MIERQSQFRRIEPAQDRPRSSFPVEMYAVSGHGEITQKVFDRYERSKRHDAVIEEPALFAEQYLSADVTQKDQILLQGLENSNVLVQRQAAFFLSDVLQINPQKQKECVKKAITVSDSVVQRYAVRQIRHFDAYEKYEYTKELLSQPQCDPYICRVLAEDVIPSVTPAGFQNELDGLASSMITKHFFDDADLTKKELEDNKIQSVFALEHIPFEAKHIPIIETAIQELPLPVPLVALDIAKRNRQQVPFYALLVNAIGRPEKEIQNKAVEMNTLLKDEEKKSFLELLESHENTALASFALLKEINFSYTNNAPEIILQGLENADSSIQKMAVEKIRFLLEKDQLKCIEKAIHLSDETLQDKLGTIIIDLQNIEDQKRIIQLVLESDNFVLQEKIIEFIKGRPAYADLRAELTEKIKGYENNGLDHRRFALYSKILSLKDRTEMEDMLVSVTERLINSTQREEQESGVEMIPFFNYEKRWDYYEQCLEKEDFTLTEKMIDQAFAFFPQEQQIIFFEKALQKADFSLQRKMIKKIAGISEWERSLQESLFEAAKRFAPEALIAPPLYDDTKKIKTEGLARENFQKTGSLTTLLLGDLQEKVIIRSGIPALSFKAWQKIYEDFDTWKEAQFDYVPIEPILSYQPNLKENAVDVMSGVLDCSVEGWFAMTFEYKEEIETQMNAITKTLEKKNIYHGHPHPDNFCLRFFRTDDNQIDFSRPPRVYIIDFDRAQKVV